MGTPSYVSPEQLATQPLDGRSDLFSLGAVLYFLLTGRVAFDGGSIPATLALVTFRDPEPPSRTTPGLPPAVDELIARAVAKNPQDRHATALDFAEDLEDVAGGRVARHLSRRRRDGSGTMVSRDNPLEALLEPSDLEPLPLPARAAHSLPAADASVSSGRRRLVLAGGALLVAAGIAALALLPGGGGTGSVGPLAPLIQPAAKLEVHLEHSLRSGTLRVYVDDDLALEEPLESHVSEDLVLLKLRKGRERALIQVKPGLHEVRVQVTGGGFDGTRRLSGAFESGETRRLHVRMGGLLSRELRASWGD